MSSWWSTPWLMVAVAVLGAGVAGARSVSGVLRNQRAHGHLDDAGRLAQARVLRVEPMQRTVNGAAGHPVLLAVDPGTPRERTVRDTTGLGGYLVRDDAEVRVRQSPANPDLVRVEEIVGPHGTYPVRRDGDRAGGPLGVLFLLTVPPIAVAGLFALTQTDVSTPKIVFPLLFLAGIVLLITGVHSVRRQRRDSGPLTGQAIGLVTDVWSDHLRARSSRRGGASQQVHPFTVHFATHDGREVHSRSPVATSGFQPQPRQPVRVRYDTIHPTRFEVAEVGASQVLPPVVMILAGVLLVLVGSLGTAAVAILG